MIEISLIVTIVKLCYSVSFKHVLVCLVLSSDAELIMLYLRVLHKHLLDCPGQVEFRLGQAF